MAVEAIILEAFGRERITLGGSGVSYGPGTLVGYSGGAWVKADADAATPIPALMILMTGGRSGEVVSACKQAILDDADLSLTVDGKIYTSGTAGAVTQTAPPAAASLAQVVGRALSATCYEINLSGSGAAQQRYVHTILTIPHTLPSGTGAAEPLTNYTPGFRGRIEGWSFVTTVAGTGSSASRTPNLEINTTDVSGSDGVALALADTAAVGQVKVLGVPTALHDFDEDDTISIEIASGGTAFTAGAGFFLIKLRRELQDS